MSQAPRRYCFPRSARLTRRGDFDRVFAARRRAADRILLVYMDRRPAEAAATPARLGIAVGRRYGNSVRRNRAKRLIREAFRHLRPELPPGTDWVVVPQPGTQADLGQVRRSLAQLTEKLIARQA